MFKGRAQVDKTKYFLLNRNVNAQRQKELCGIPVSQFGFGTYLGSQDEVTDVKVAVAINKAETLGLNLIDTAINYRGQRGERSVGEAMRRIVLSGRASRESFFISTKGGFVPAVYPPQNDLKDTVQVFEHEYVTKGLAKKSDLAADCHCMAPKYLANQIEQSLKNLQLETIDLYYLHNPETQLHDIPEALFYERLVDAFETFEVYRKEGKIVSYGLATWNGFREETGSQFLLQLEKVVQAAEAAADRVQASKHGLRAIQLPFNIAMTEALRIKNQQYGSQRRSVFELASTFQLDLVASAPLFQSRLCHALPDSLVDCYPHDYSQAHAALDFATGFDALSVALVGMKALDHVEHNLALLHRARPDNSATERLLALLQNMA